MDHDFQPDTYQDPAEFHTDQFRRLRELSNSSATLARENAALRARLEAIHPLCLPLTPAETQALAVDTLTPSPL